MLIYNGACYDQKATMMIDDLDTGHRHCVDKLSPWCQAE
jgi:hypothetical protein